MSSLPLLVCGMSTWQFVSVICGACLISAIHLITCLSHAYNLEQFLTNFAGGLFVALPFLLLFWYPLCILSSPFPAADNSRETATVIWVYFPLAVIVACVLFGGLIGGSNENANGCGGVK